MFVGKLVFAQVMDFLPLHTFRRCVGRYPSSYVTQIENGTRRDTLETIAKLATALGTTVGFDTFY